MSSYPEPNFLDGYNLAEVKPRPQSWPIRLLKLAAIIMVGVSGILLVFFWRSMAADPAPGAPTDLSGRANLNPAQQAFLKHRQVADQLREATPVTDVVTAEWLLRTLDFTDRRRAVEFLEEYEIDDENLSLLHFRIEESLNDQFAPFLFEDQWNEARETWQRKLRHAIQKVKDRQSQSHLAARPQRLSWEQIEELAKALAMDRELERDPKYDGRNPALPLPSAAENAATDQARLVEEQLRTKAKERALVYVEQELNKPHDKRWVTKIKPSDP